MALVSTISQESSASDWLAFDLRIGRTRTRTRRGRNGLDEVGLTIFAVKACTVLRDLQIGIAIDSNSKKNSRSRARITGSLINMYVKCGSMDDARFLFDSNLSIRDVISWTNIITGYAETGHFDAALSLLATMQHEGCAPNERTFTAVLKACSGLASREEGNICKMEAVGRGRALHLQIASGGFESDAFVASGLVEMYAKCGRIADAKAVFDKMMLPDVVAWTVLMQGYVENALEETALELLARMREDCRCSPNARTFSVAVKACAALAAKEVGREVDGKIVKVSSLAKGMDIHSDAVNRGWSSEAYLAASLIDFYGKCGSPIDARMIFDKMVFRNVVSWNSLILGYVENDEEDLALELLKSMKCSCCHPDSRTLAAAAKACSNLAAKEAANEVDGKVAKIRPLEKGREVHSLAEDFGKDVFLGSALIEMYSQCGSVIDAQRVYAKMSTPDVVSWTTLIMAYVENGDETRALEVFECMKPDGCKPDSGALLAALKACSGLAGSNNVSDDIKSKLKLRALEKTMMIHWEALRNHDLDSSIIFENTLVDTYAKCGSLEDARKAFDRMRFHSVVSLTVLITGCSENGNEELALELFSAMKTDVDSQCFVAALNACIGLAAKETGKPVNRGNVVKLRALDRVMALHSEAAMRSLDSDLFVGNTLVELYANCGSLLDARRVFDRMPCRNFVSWHTLLLGYAENGEGELALELYSEPRNNEEVCSTIPQAFTLAAVLKSCSSLVDLESGRSIHALICRHGREIDEILVACLLDLYGKCGSTVNSQVIFDSTTGHDLVGWNTLLSSYARHGDIDQVLGLFHSMQDEGCSADAATFVSVLTACSHAGLVDRGRRYFDKMESEYGVGPGLEHYHCMIDLLGRSSRVEEAFAMAKSMPFEASSVTWRTVLAACGKWKNSRVGMHAFESLMELGDERDVDAAHLLIRFL